MDVGEIDPADDAAMRDWHSVYAAAQQARGGPEGPDPYDFVAAQLRFSPPSEPNRLWVGYDGPTPVVALEGNWYETGDNRHRFDVFGDVLPGRSPGGEVLTPLADAARSLGRTVLGIDAAEGGPLAAVAEGLGARLGQQELHSVLRTGEVDAGEIEAWTAPVPGYELVRWDDDCPDELMAAFLPVRNAMNDAPRGGLAIEDFVHTPERVRGWDRTCAARGVTRWVVAVRATATGELAGYTELELSRWRPTFVEQGNTVVVAAHRGHGLGRLVKAANLLRLLRERPEVEAVETWNAAENSHMLAINIALGFRPRERWNEYEIAL